MRLQFFDQLAHSTHGAISRLIVRSALNPLLWFSGLMTPICFGAAYLFREEKIAFYLVLISGLAPLALTMTVATYFAFWKTEKLQSEDYQLRSQSLQIVREKARTLLLDPTSLEGIANPTLGTAFTNQLSDEGEAHE